MWVSGGSKERETTVGKDYNTATFLTAVRRFMAT